MKGSSESTERVSFFRGKLSFYQSKNLKISVDKVVFLSRIEGIKKRKRVIELGAGFGFLSISIAKKYGVSITTLEVDEEAYRLLLGNIKLNSVEKLITPYKADLRNVKGLFKKASFDVVVMNPPFYSKRFAGSSEPNPYEVELKGGIEDFIKAAAYLLKDSGYLNILFPSFRLYELFLIMNRYNVHPAKLSILYPTPDKGGKLAVIVGRKNLKPDLRVDEPVILNDSSGSYMRDISILLENWL